MKWIMFYQTPYDRVKYISDESEDTSSLSYAKFLEFLIPILHKNYLEIKDHLDSFHYIYLDMETCDFKQIIPQRDHSISFEELYELNKNDAAPKDIVDQSKEYMNNIFKWRKENNG